MKGIQGEEEGREKWMKGGGGEGREERQNITGVSVIYMHEHFPLASSLL